MKYDFSKMVMKGGKIVQVRGGALVPMVNGEGPEPGPEPSDKLIIGDKEYSIKEMPDGNIWMTEDLAYNDNGTGIYVKNNVYYYDYDAAKRIADNIPGWHVPSIEEWKTLVNPLADNIQETYDQDGELMWYYSGISEKLLLSGSNILNMNIVPHGRYEEDDGSIISPERVMLQTSNLSPTYPDFSYHFYVIPNSTSNDGKLDCIGERNYINCTVRLIKDK